MKPTSRDFSNEDGTLTIHGIGTSNPVFSSLDATFADYFTQFNEFKCRVLSVHYYTPNRHLDLSKIAKPHIVWRMLLGLHGDRTTVTLPDNPEEAFRNLVEMKIDGIPKNFFSFPTLQALKVLDVTYDSKACDWKQHDGIIDLTLRGFKENDLSQLVGMTSLKRLSIVGGTIKSLNGIENLANLETICFYKTQQLLSMDGLLNSTSLRNIKCEAYRKVKNWNFLAAKKNIENLSFEEADSLQFIAHLPALNFIYCKKVGDKDQSPLTTHSNIQKQWQNHQKNVSTPVPFYCHLIDYEAIISAPVDMDSGPDHIAPTASTEASTERQPPFLTETNGLEYWSDTGNLLMAEVKDQGRRNPTFLSNGMGFNAHAALIDENNCRFVSINFPTADINLSLINRPENVLRLHIEGKGEPFKVPLSVYDRFTHLIDLAVTDAAESFLNIKQFRALKKLDVTYNKQSNWVEHESIIDLHIHALKTANLQCLSKMKSLKRLRIDVASIESLDGLELLPHLESLLINDVKNLISFEALFQTKTLKHLRIEKYKKNMDWSFLVNLKTLESLYLYEATSIQFIKDMPALEVVVCEKLGDKDRTPIENHPKIQWREEADEQSRNAYATNLPSPLWNRQLVEVAALLGVDINDHPLKQ